jgi:succinoglycan biosynthesis protein ExoA
MSTVRASELARGSIADEFVSVLVPVRNEAASVEACLHSILTQEGPRLEVLVVDGGSDDGTVLKVLRIAKGDPRVRLVEAPGASIPAALNRGLEEAKGDWLVRVDGHATISPGYLHRVVELLRSGEWGGVGGRKDGVARTETGKAIAAAMGSRFGVGNSRYHYTRGACLADHVPFGAYPVLLLREVGGWDERLEANEDFDLDYRLRKRGWRLLLDPTVQIAWECRQSIADLFRQYRRYGRGKANMLKLHPDAVSARHVVAPALVATWMSIPLVAVRHRWAAAGLVAPYAAALVMASVVVGRRVPGVRARMAVPGAFMAMHAGWGLGFWEATLGNIRNARTGAGRRRPSG